MPQEHTYIYAPEILCPRVESDTAAAVKTLIQREPSIRANKQAPIKAKLEKATAELEEAMVGAEEARREFEGDFVLQLMSFRQKGVVRQAAFVGAVLIANQAVFQAVLVADDRGGSPVIALGGLAASAALVWYYGYRPIKL